MAGKEGSRFDYAVIILIAAGVTLLGGNELAKNHSKLQKKEQQQPVMTELREDLSAQLLEGAPLEQLTANSEQELRARYPFSIERPIADPAMVKSEGEEERPTVAVRLKRMLGMERKGIEKPQNN